VAAAALLAAVVLGLGTRELWRGPEAGAPGGAAGAPAAQASAQVDGLQVFGANDPARKALAPAGVPAGQEFSGWLAQSSSLRGATLDGSWGDLDSNGRLKPERAIRRRFDQLLTLVGEKPLPEISAWVQAQSAAALGPQGGAELVRLWKNYLALQQEPLRSAVDLGDRKTWAAAQAERQGQRVRHLGFEWARAFFAEEEAALAALMQSPPAAGAQALIDPATLTPSQREAWLQAQADTADWERRMAQARQNWASLQQQPQWSETQRQAQLQAHLESHFNADERRRVRALLGLNP
jgi:lipase chaperone LimK